MHLSHRTRRVQSKTFHLFSKQSKVHFKNEQVLSIGVCDIEKKKIGYLDIFGDFFQ